MQTIHTGQAVPITATGRAAVARRLKAARVLAGDPPLRAVSAELGFRYSHLIGIVNATEHATDSDLDALAERFDVPSEWLARGWPQQQRDATS